MAHTILGGDLATRSGFSLYDKSAPISSTKCWSFVAGGKDDPKEALAWNLADHLIECLTGLSKVGKLPVLIAIERPFEHIQTFDKKGADLAGETSGVSYAPRSTLLPQQLIGSVCGVAAGFRIPVITLTSSTCRKAFLGYGRKAGWVRKDWKKAARRQCDQLRIKAKNDDEAESVGVGVAASGTQEYRSLLS